MSGIVTRFVSLERDVPTDSYPAWRTARIILVVIPALIITTLVDAIRNAASTSYYHALEFWDGLISFTGLVSGLMFSHEAWNSRIPLESNKPYWSLGYKAPYYIMCALSCVRRPWTIALMLFAWPALFSHYVALYRNILGVKLLYKTHQ